MSKRTTIVVALLISLCGMDLAEVQARTNIEAVQGKRYRLGRDIDVNYIAFCEKSD